MRLCQAISCITVFNKDLSFLYKFTKVHDVTHTSVQGPILGSTLEGADTPEDTDDFC